MCVGLFVRFILGHLSPCVCVSALVAETTAVFKLCFCHTHVGCQGHSKFTPGVNICYWGPNKPLSFEYLPNCSSEREGRHAGIMLELKASIL